MSEAPKDVRDRAERYMPTAFYTEDIRRFCREAIAAAIMADRLARPHPAPATDGESERPVDFAVMLAQLRAEGWAVAVHNDYRLNGEPHTFWLFTRSDGRWIKGEGRTDDEALAHALAARPAVEHDRAIEAARGYVVDAIAEAKMSCDEVDEGYASILARRTKRLDEIVGHLRVIDAALASEPEPQPVADGWVLVPMEPTEAMVQAFCDGWYWKSDHDWADAWRIMLAAAPHPTEEPTS